MTLDEAIQHAREVAASGCSECCKEHAQLAEWLEELLRRREEMAVQRGQSARLEHALLQARKRIEELEGELKEALAKRAEQDSLDAMCSQIEKVVRTESDDGDWFAALLKDGTWAHFHEVNTVLQRFIFDSTHAVRSYVDYTGQTEYTR